MKKIVIAALAALLLVGALVALAENNAKESAPADGTQVESTYPDIADAQDGVLTISANMNNERKSDKNGYVYSERRTGTFRRSFNLEGIREDAITARYEDGILTLYLPKVKLEEERPQVRRIAIAGPSVQANAPEQENA